MKSLILFLLCLIPSLRALCPEPFEELSNGKYYYLTPNRMSWFDAQKKCLEINSTLAEIESQEENYVLVGLLHKEGK